jgi:thiol-disulfide isomerase/thioredoxin
VLAELAREDLDKLSIAELDERIGALEAEIARHAGKVVVVDCWSTSCPPCVKEFPRLVALQKTHGDKVACISISLDYEGIDAAEDLLPPVQKFLDKVGAGGIVNLLCTEEADAVYRKLDLVSVPAIYVHGPDGKLVQRFDEDDAAKRLKRPFTYDDVGAVVDRLVTRDERPVTISDVLDRPQRVHRLDRVQGKHLALPAPRGGGHPVDGLAHFFDTDLPTGLAALVHLHRPSLGNRQGLGHPQAEIRMRVREKQAAAAAVPAGPPCDRLQSGSSSIRGCEVRRRVLAQPGLRETQHELQRTCAG